MHTCFALRETLCMILEWANQGTVMRRESVTLMRISHHFLDAFVAIITDIPVSGFRLDCLPRYKNLRVLRMEGIPIPLTTVRALTRLEKLIIQNPYYCGSSWDMDYDGVLQSIDHLTELHVYDAHQAVSTQTMLHLQTTLRCLTLKENRLSAEPDMGLLTGLASLTLIGRCGVRDHTLQQLTQLNSLLLANNGDITDASLSRLTALTVLGLGGTSTITDHGLHGLTSLTALDLSCNNSITDVGLSGLTALQILELDNNKKITRDGVLPLRDSLLYLDISACTGVLLEDAKEFTRLQKLIVANMGIPRRILLHRLEGMFPSSVTVLIK